MSLLDTPQQSLGGVPLGAHLAAVDARWVELHAALIAAGVPPLPGDSDAVHTIARQLDDATVSSVVAWIDSAASR
ncbi:hypothetical protein ACFW3D_10445 [Streptomyces sp. NPDC058864]|uniref:hypothetical protein n=1 Tax=Actinacidiphila sp. bgisy160 TaxID=3413796 RepID=UPI0036BDE401